MMRQPKRARKVHVVHLFPLKLFGTNQIMGHLI